MSYANSIKYLMGLGHSQYWKSGAEVFLDYEDWEAMLSDYSQGILFLADVPANDIYPWSFIAVDDPEWPSLKQIVDGTITV